MFGTSFGGFGIVYALLALSFLIFFHEFGHFIAARIFKVKVEVFSIGFGKKLFKKVWGGTEYCISAVPLGGYVQMKGQNDMEPLERNEEEDSYNKKAPWKRIIILFAGPFANFLLAFFLYICIGNLGVRELAAQIGSFSNNSIAQNAGLQINDTIKEINGARINVWDDVKKNIQLSAGEIDMLIERNKKLLHVKLTPQTGENKNIFGESVQEKLIGISPSYSIINMYYSGFESIVYAKDEVIRNSLLIFQTLKKLVIDRIISPKELGGIIAIVDITSDAAKLGLATFLMLTALISVNLGVLNLLPIPALDGGHIMFNMYELIFRRAPNEKVFYYMTIAGWALLMSLVAFTIYNDIARIITQKI
ncbi:MAG: RIP metalloprotease RseP [Campylobacteraceae bacterium]|jgi:regulator of sigma E protease|nr:RIP metalloprotease RseP [Campylobacteraceae bacterium]